MIKYLTLVAAIVLGMTAGAWAGSGRSEVVDVWKSPLCGCCGGWVEYMESQGFKVVVHKDDDMDAVKRRLNVPEEVWSCHTARIGPYVVEGHVPVEAIDKLLRERPKGVAGIASPGMPQGSPGMSGPKERNVIVAFGADPVRVFAVH